jgi:muramoyltetrapeptide carboxypeptidase
MKTAAYLKKGDTVLLIATARKVSEEELNPAILILKKWGLKVELGANIFKKKNQFAGTDLQRAADLQWAIDHPKAKAVLIVRGGYGTIRLMDKVSFKPIRKAPKWFVGYSDITSIHNELNNNEVQSIHATMPINFTKNKAATESLKNALFGININYPFKNNSLNKIGNGEGELVGGNLSLLYALAGTKNDLYTKNKILFIEDLDEYLYHIDRMMLQLKRSGKLKKLKGLIVGGMSEMKDNSIPFGKTAEQIILECVAEYNYPVCFSFPAGHIEENTALYLGKKVALTVTKTKTTLNYL